MIYYYGGKFNPWTRGHYAVLNALCKKIQNDGCWKKENSCQYRDTIVIGITTLIDRSGIEGHVLCSSMEYRAEMIAVDIRKLIDHYDFLDENCVKMVEQDNLSTYEFLKRYCEDEQIPVWENNVTLVLGEDEWDDLESSVNSEISKWKYADKLVNFHRFVYSRKSINSQISSTKVREILHRNPYVSFDEVKEYISYEVFRKIKENKLYWQYGYEDEYRKEEINALRKYDITKYPRPSATVDLIVIQKTEDQNNMILLIRRKNFPYKGYWALPGGFLDIDEDETLENAASRELYEETNIDYVIERDHQFRTYSDMGTDPRGRIVDTVYAIVDSKWCPMASDDACEIGWFDLNDLPRMAFNHRQIIEDYQKSLKKK